MRPVANQQGQFFTTAKNHKFDSIEDIYVEKLKFKPIISQTGTFTYSCKKVIVEYSKSLFQNDITSRIHNVFQKCCEIYLH